MTTATGMGARLPSLTGLRFPAALIVFLLHAAQQSEPGRLHDLAWAIAGRGYIGVSFFFVLSGFVLAWSARPGDRPLAFYRRRLARIAPVYLVCLVGTAALLALAGRLSLSALPSVVAVQAWFPDPAVHFAANRPGWSIAAEMFFYLCFPLLVPLLATAKGRRLLAGLGIGLVTVPAVLLRPTGLATSDASLWAIYVLPVPRLGEFILGMLVARAVLAGWRPRIGLGASLWILVVAYVATGFAPVWATICLITLAPVALVLAAGASADLEQRRTWWSTPAAQRLGEWSFAFYLAQEAFLLVQDEVQERLALGPVADWLLLGLTFVGVLTAAGLLHTRVERPWERRLRPRLLDRVQ